MPLSRTFKNTIQARVRRDAKFRKELLREGIDCLLAGDLETGKTVLRDYINATVGFPKLSRVTRIPPKSLMRMLGPNGNPRAQNIFDIVAGLQQHEGIRLSVRSITARSISA